MFPLFPSTTRSHGSGNSSDDDAYPSTRLLDSRGESEEKEVLLSETLDRETQPPRSRSMTVETRSDDEYAGSDAHETKESTPSATTRTSVTGVNAVGMLGN